MVRPGELSGKLQCNAMHGNAPQHTVNACREAKDRSRVSELGAGMPHVQSSTDTLLMTFLYPAKSLILNGITVSDNLLVQFLDERVFGVPWCFPPDPPCKYQVRTAIQFISAYFSST
jgi:hypothetical protein